MWTDPRHASSCMMNEYDVQMASTGSANEAPGDYSKRMRDKKIMLAQYPGPDAKRFYSWTNGPLAKHLANKGRSESFVDRGSPKDGDNMYIICRHKYEAAHVVCGTST